MCRFIYIYIYTYVYIYIYIYIERERVCIYVYIHEINTHLDGAGVFNVPDVRGMGGVRH